MTVPTTMTVACNGGEVFCRIAGEGPPLLIPGHASTSLFTRLATEFGDEYTVIGNDLRDAGGKTVFPPVPFTVEDLADDLAFVLDELGFDRAHYLGLSHTGVLGQGFALRHPDRLNRLALTMTTPGRQAAQVDLTADAVADRSLPVEDELADRLSSAQMGGSGAALKLAELSHSEAWAKANPQKVATFAEEVYEKLFSQDQNATRRFWGALATFNAREQLSSITVPTLVMTGSGDRMLSVDDSWTLWRDIPRATLVALDGVGHEWYDEATELGARVVKSFFNGDFDFA